MIDESDIIGLLLPAAVSMSETTLEMVHASDDITEVECHMSRRTWVGYHRMTHVRVEANRYYPETSPNPLVVCCPQCGNTQRAYTLSALRERLALIHQRTTQKDK